jgi:hypothetical protein
VRAVDDDRDRAVGEGRPDPVRDRAERDVQGAGYPARVPFAGLTDVEQDRARVGADERLSLRRSDLAGRQPASPSRAAAGSVTSSAAGRT